MEKRYDITTREIAAWLTSPGLPAPTPDELARAEAELLAFAGAHACPTPEALRGAIFGKLEQVIARESREPVPLDLLSLPLLDDSANWRDWAVAVRGIDPPEDFGNIHLHPLASDEQRQLFLIWVREYVDQETHDDVLESVLLLEGSCECHLTSPAGETRVVRLSQGDFLTMPLGYSHDLLITSGRPAKGILQWLRTAA